jgi:hypothetical protein
VKTSTSFKVEIAPEVWEYLRRRSAEEEFRLYGDLAREWFPDAAAGTVYLLEDPDEEDRCWVVFRLTFTAGSYDELFARKRRFYEKLEEQTPAARFPDPVCSLDIDVADG